MADDVLHLRAVLDREQHGRPPSSLSWIYVSRAMVVALLVAAVTVHIKYQSKAWIPNTSQTSDNDDPLFQPF